MPDRKVTYLFILTSICTLSGACASAFAADIPAKAMKVDYVKTCSAYGAGFYYISGSDTCLKMGGYVWFAAMANGSQSFNPGISNEVLGNGLLMDDTKNWYTTRTRAIAQFDARNETELGTLRGFIGVGANLDSWSGANGGAQVDLQQAMVQFAGMTAGYTTSVFQPNLDYMLTNPFTQMNRKVNLVSYMVQFDNGLSASMAVEDGRFHSVLNNQALGPDHAAMVPADINVRGGSELPDLVGTLRLEQAWGLAQLSVAAHQSRVAYNSAHLNAAGDVWGWAIGGALEFKLPQLAAGDSFFVTAAFGEGALNYVGFSGSDRTDSLATQFGRVNGLGNGAFYQLSYVVYNETSGAFDSTKAWSVTGQVRHFWTPALRSAVMGGYAQVDAPDSAYAYQNGFVNFNIWQVGVNTVWSPVHALDIAVEAVYSKVEGDHVQGYNLATQNLAISKGQAYGGTADVFSGGLRIMRSF